MSALLERRSGPALPEPEPRAADSRVQTLALVGAMVVCAGLILYLGRGTGFFFDEWEWIFDRRGWSADTLLLPHNEHLSLVPILIYKLGFATVGLKSYLPYRLVALALHLTCGGLVYVYARRRVGATLALVAAVVLLFLGPAWQDIFWAFQIGYFGSLAAGLGALLALDRRTRAGDVTAGVLLTVSLASSSVGIPVLAAVALDVASAPALRRRWPIVVVPAALYGLWYLKYGVPEGITQNNILATPAYVADAASATVGAAVGLSADYGRVLALALAALVAWRALTLVARPWRLAVTVALPLAFWTLTGLARAQYHEPGASRYLYPGVLFVLLVLCETAVGLRLGRRALLLVGLLLLGITVSNVGAMRNGAGWMRDRHSGIEGGLAAARLVGASVPDAFQPAPVDSPQISMGAYRALQDSLPAPPADPRREPPLGRAATDSALLTLHEIALKPGGGATGAASLTAAGVTVARAAGCTEASGNGTATVSVPSGGLTVSAQSGSVAVAVRRFAATPAALGTINPGSTETVTARPDASSAPWVAQLTIGGRARVCGV